eukprot:tig00000147_g9448.t1
MAGRTVTLLGAIAAILAIVSCAVASPGRPPASSTPPPARNANFGFAVLIPDQNIPRFYARWDKAALNQSVAIALPFQAFVSVDDAEGVDFTGYSATLECRNLGSGPGFEFIGVGCSDQITCPEITANPPVFNWRPKTWVYRFGVRSEFGATLIVPNADGVLLPRSANIIPSWNVGDRYACTARIVRPDGTVSAPSAPPLIVRATKGYGALL